MVNFILLMWQMLDGYWSIAFQRLAVGKSLFYFLVIVCKLPPGMNEQV